jgi:RHS repeat-associated protein
MPQQLIQKNGAKVWGGEFRAFGELTAETGSWENRLRFPGQYYDSETGNYYNYFRDYDPTTGRYLQSDPIGLDGGLNTYSYVLNNPILYYDPTGENWRNRVAEIIIWVAATIGSDANPGKMKPPPVRPPVEQQIDRSTQKKDKRKSKKGGTKALSPWEFHFLNLCVQGLADCKLCESLLGGDFCDDDWCTI